MTAADSFRAAREAFELGMQMGCTPRDAARALRRRRAACGRVADDQVATPSDNDQAQASAPATDFQSWNNQWMMRE